MFVLLSCSPIMAMNQLQRLQAINSYNGGIPKLNYLMYIIFDSLRVCLSQEIFSIVK